MTINLFTALMLAAGGFFLGLREIVLSPQNRTFPCAPLAVRVAMFMASAVLCGLAVLFIGHPQPYAGQAATPVAGVASIMALYNLIMCLNLLGQRYRPEVWARINRMESTARSAPPRSAVAYGKGLHRHG